MENSTFRTVIKTKPVIDTIEYSSKVVLFGSCFSENIGKKLDYYKFDVHTNPYGILFNPVAIETAITECVQRKKYEKSDLFFHNEQWHSYKHHSDYSHHDADVALENINNSIQETYNKLKSASHLILTLGTAWVYEHIEHNQIVANCHKVPQKEFRKKLLTIKEIVACLGNIKKMISTINPSVKIVLTVSPVRHLKDGMVENSRSKAQLLSSIHSIIDSQTHYFQSYEIMMDDLRDYRFYEKDMIHPNEIAINYIWHAFNDTWISNKTFAIQKEIEVIQKGLSHKPFNPKSSKHKLFQEKLALKIKSLQDTYNISF